MEANRRRISHLRWCGLSGFAALGTLVGGLVLAADAAPTTEPGLQLQEVVVTAQYREEKLQDTPIAITARMKLTFVKNSRTLIGSLPERHRRQRDVVRP